MTKQSNKALLVSQLLCCGYWLLVLNVLCASRMGTQRYGIYTATSTMLAEDAVLDFFLQRMALFTTPELVVEDLNQFDVDGRQVTPSVALTLQYSELVVM